LADNAVKSIKSDKIRSYNGRTGGREIEEKCTSYLRRFDENIGNMKGTSQNGAPPFNASPVDRS